MTVTIQSEGRRHYLVGNTFPIKDAIRSAGCKWDGERKAWWTGKLETAEQLVASLASSSASEATSGSGNGGPGESAVVAGRAKYKGKTYYLAGREVRGRNAYDSSVDTVTSRDGSRVLLISRDGSLQFWAARPEVTVEKTYQKPTTIRKLREFAADPEGAVRKRYRDRYGWDGVVGSASYYSSGLYDEES